MTLVVEMQGFVQVMTLDAARAILYALDLGARRVADSKNDRLTVYRSRDTSSLYVKNPAELLPAVDSFSVDEGTYTSVAYMEFDRATWNFRIGWSTRMPMTPWSELVDAEQVFGRAARTLRPDFKPKFKDLMGSGSRNIDRMEQWMLALCGREFPSSTLGKIQFVPAADS